MQVKFTFNTTTQNYKDIESKVIQKLDCLTGVKFIEGDYILFGIRLIQDKLGKPLVELALKYEDYNMDKFSVLVGQIQDMLYNDLVGIYNIKRNVLSE